MKTECIHALTSTFEGLAQKTESGIEFLLALDLHYLLSCSEWRSFLQVTSKAKSACELSGHATSNHFVEVKKMLDLGSGVSARWMTLC